MKVEGLTRVKVQLAFRKDLVDLGFESLILASINLVKLIAWEMDEGFCIAN